MNKSSGAIAGIALAWLFWGQEEWTLMVCKEKLNDAECYSNSYVIDGFDTKKECMLEGASKFSGQGFECGMNCRNESGMQVCEEICNARGCGN
ncbi:MAG: hypothetical protein MN733_05680 [Nitrososphaera sp.]|nr:hypothetical protein [Nitrososphaera sp.]